MAEKENLKMERLSDDQLSGIAGGQAWYGKDALQAGNVLDYIIVEDYPEKPCSMPGCSHKGIQLVNLKLRYPDCTVSAPARYWHCTGCGAFWEENDF